jgi:hypothetical protein
MADTTLRTASLWGLFAPHCASKLPASGCALSLLGILVAIENEFAMFVCHNLLFSFENSDLPQWPG